ncbi:MAG TPA: HAD family hydrolase [Xanthomonadaceae bacterium]|nr:HAD family hydrolase [Xanthomonadaceae bacterium]
MSTDYLSEIPLDIRDRAARVKLLAIDVDGTLTDGQLWYTPEGEQFKGFNVLDGFGMKALREQGIEVALITTRESLVVAARARELGLRHVFQGATDKLHSLTHLLHALTVVPSEVAFMGDDLPDLPVLTRVGLSLAPADAHPWVRSRVHWCTRSVGGHGAVREACDLILSAQGLAERVLHRFLPE